VTSHSLRERIEAALTPLHGWTTPEKGTRLAELVIAAESALSVEIGVFGGRGTIAMAIGHQRLGRGHVVGIDPWEVAASLDGENAPANDDWWRTVDHDAIYEHFVSALVHNNVVRFCRIMRERSDSAIRLFGDDSIALLHQDGNHSEAISAAEVETWTPKLRPGGFWVADDTDWSTTQRAQQMLIERRFELLEDHGGWRVYRKP
jgi:predicted O-methyltransferase YrrM